MSQVNPLRKLLYIGIGIVLLSPFLLHAYDSKNREAQQIRGAFIEEKKARIAFLQDQKIISMKKAQQHSNQYKANLQEKKKQAFVMHQKNREEIAQELAQRRCKNKEHRNKILEKRRQERTAWLQQLSKKRRHEQLCYEQKKQEHAAARRKQMEQKLINQQKKKEYIAHLVTLGNQKAMEQNQEMIRKRQALLKNFRGRRLAKFQELRRRRRHRKEIPLQTALN
ncbi:hypothetical protein E3J79_01330 [Candidatus Dependentiae bacterium]|nr:MAG: hypothetical protein E3J79_01330 [Candidatus Dependentiae bacterium]